MRATIKQFKNLSMLVAGILFLFMIFMNTYIIPTGYTGVLVRFGQIDERPERKVSACRAAADPYLVVRERKTRLERFGEDKPRRADAVVAAGGPAVRDGRQAVLNVERREAKLFREESRHAFPARAVAHRPPAAVDGQDKGRVPVHVGRQEQIAQAERSDRRVIRNVADNSHLCRSSHASARHGYR